MGKEKKNIGLLFGSFNPIHLGHMIIAEFMVNNTDLDETWFVVSPHNPLKKKETLLADIHRLAMVRIAVENDSRFRVCDIEFKMPKPSYTIHTLTYLSEKYPDYQFTLIAGTDILPTFNKWKNYEKILDNYHIYIYPRPGKQSRQFLDNTNVQLIKAPMIEISSSNIRQYIREGKKPVYMLLPKVWQYIQEMHFYKK
ncbi:MAG: nicotinate (nicotinamide) nucleotide adenylyltransferase [Lentimicrobiaceae bacterium]|nr:nicotinate (nicotinamide) nucleotide adenylyltransferase [Lentimicrobiaceae bacterium]